MRDETFRMEKELHPLKEGSPLGASRDSGTGQLNKEGITRTQLIEESKAATKIWEPGEDPYSDDDGLGPQIGHFALRGQLEISESECPRGRTHEGGRPRGGTHGEEVRKTALQLEEVLQMEEELLLLKESPPSEASGNDEPLSWISKTTFLPTINQMRKTSVLGIDAHNIILRRNHMSQSIAGGYNANHGIGQSSEYNSEAISFGQESGQRG